MAENESAYVEEQESLARQLETGEVAASHLREEVEKAMVREPEVDPKVYEGVEQILFRGFITQFGEVANVPFVFKSLNHHEIEHLSWYSASRDQTRYHNLFLAYSVFMTDGINVLADRETNLEQLVKFFSDIPDGARRKLIRYVSEVNRRANNAVSLTEAYAMEQYSRFRWVQLRGLDLTSTAVTGIDGTMRLGLNWGQLVWRAMNTYEDSREEGEREWDNAKFVGGCLAGKGIQKVYNQDRERRKKEKEERIARKDRLLRHILLGESPEATKKQGFIVKAANTVDELVTQLEGDLRGEKDWHDQVVAAEEERMRQQNERRRTHLMEMVAENDARFGDSNVIGGSEIAEGLTPAEVKQRIARRKQLEAQVAAQAIHPALLDERYEKFQEKWGTYQQGDLADRDPEMARPVEPPKPPGTPFRRK